MQVPITIWALPFVLSKNTPKGDDWVEEEGLGKELISNVFKKLKNKLLKQIQIH